MPARFNRSTRAISALGAALLLPVSGGAFAQSYPVKPIRMLIGFSAGSTTDVLARTVGQKIAEAWGQQMVVDNRPGAGGIKIGRAHV